MIKLNWCFRLCDLQLVVSNAWVEKTEAKVKNRKNFSNERPTRVSHVDATLFTKKK